MHTDLYRSDIMVDLLCETKTEPQIILYKIIYFETNYEFFTKQAP